MLNTITQFKVGGLDKNMSYVIADIATRHAVIVDPTGDIDTVLKNIKEAGYTVSAIWLTHAHQDHYDQVPAVFAAYGELPILVHESAHHTIANTYQTAKPIKDGDTCGVGDITFTVLHTPGHSPDGVCFYREASADEAPLLLSGDTLFVHGCGRTTPEEVQNLYESLQKIKRLPGRTIVYPGHDYGPVASSTIAHELSHNRFLKAVDYDAFYAERFPSY